MSGIFIHNEGDVLHRFRTEPTRHVEGGVGVVERTEVYCVPTADRGLATQLARKEGEFCLLVPGTVL